MINISEMIDLIWIEVDKYKPLTGIILKVSYVDPGTCTTLKVDLIYKYPNGDGGGYIPYAYVIPHFWYEMSEEYIAKECQTQIRYLIKTSMSVEIERLFGWKDGGFNPL